MSWPVSGSVPLVVDLVPIVDRWGAGKEPDAWLFHAPEGGPLVSRIGSARSAGALPRRHATAAMTMDLYGHLVDANLWEAAQAIGGILGASEPPEQQDDDEDGTGTEESAR